MPIPHVFAPIHSGDFTITPTTVHKRYVIQRSDLFSGDTPLTGSGYKLLEARYLNGKMKLGTDTIYPTNSFDGSYQNAVWNQIDAMYYRNPTSNSRYTYKFLNYSASIIQIPQHDFGEGIKPGSVEFTGSVINFKDDGHGNLYNPNINTSSFPDRTDILLYLDFDDSFKLTRDSTVAFNGSVKYGSHQFQPDFAVYDNVKFGDGISFNSVASNTKSAQFNGTSSILIPNRNEFDFGSDYTLSFWIKPETASISTVFSKRGTITEVVRDSNGNDSLTTYTKLTNVYPFDIFFDTNVLKFLQNDGNGATTIHNINMVADGTWYHVCYSVSGSQSTAYLNGVSQGNAAIKPIRNQHDIVIGALSVDYTTTQSGLAGVNTQFKGNLANIRIYNKALSANQVQSIGQWEGWDYSEFMAVYGTPIYGNVFYKTGTIVFTHKNAILPYVMGTSLIEDSFTLKFRNTHTFYQYETLCRIKKGDFNISQNPSALKNPYTDLLIDDMTTGSLYPYATAVGLYDDAGNLMAVGKLGQPLKMRDDVNINLIVRWDV